MVKKIICKIANSLWILLSKNEWKKFFNNLTNIEEIQKNILFSIISKNANTLYGKEHDFASINSIEEFQERVPLTNYEYYNPYIKKIAKGDKNILTKEQVLMFELSSGSTSASKYIPYTKTLKQEFQKAIKAWIYDLYTSNRELSWGKSYWSITPVSNSNVKTSGGISIGFEEDSEYFGFLEQFLLNLLFAAPSELKNIADMDFFKYVTLLFLLKEKNLTLVSVWNPTFLLLLLEPFNDWKDKLVLDLRTGTISITSDKVSDDLIGILEKKLGKNKHRAEELSDILKLDDNKNEPIFEKIWPYLKLISCWTSANASNYVYKIKKYFPNVIIQGKGLLATEGFISFPLMGYDGSILAFNSHFLEFIEYPYDGEPLGKDAKLIHELELDKVYSVVITTGGGFYRYMLYDLVKVIGFIKGGPIIEFVGKEEKVSDYFGEKVNEYHVNEILNRLLEKFEIKPEFQMLAPDIDNNENYYYTLFLETDANNSDAEYQKLQTELEKELLENYHYKYCRELEQLKVSRIFIISNDANKTFIEVCQSQGQRVGDIKPTVLHAKTGWSKKFTGKYVS